MLAAFPTAASDMLTVSIPQSWLFGVLGATIAALLVAATKKAWPLVRAHFSSVARLHRAEAALSPSGPGLWLAPSIAIAPPDGYEKALRKCKPPIIVVANLKGGVGKTTTVANLIAHYGLKKNKRVLAIDIDFQGSVSGVILSEGNSNDALQEQIDGNPSKAAQLVEGRSGEWIRNTSIEVDGVTNARCIPSYYTLSSMENRVMVEWLIGKRTDDIRYSIARTLQSETIQERFDIVLIDAPPRLTTGCVQALCAATHVLVPTVLDGLSAEAAGGFVDQLKVNQKLWPHLRLLGVFGNMTNSLTAELDGSIIDGRLSDYEEEARRTVDDAVKQALQGAALPLRPTAIDIVLPLNCFIPQKRELGNAAGNRIVYRLAGGSEAVQQVSRAFDRLGDEIDRRISATSVG
jgi:chromosome partitioning protein